MKCSKCGDLISLKTSVYSGKNIYCTDECFKSSEDYETFMSFLETLNKRQLILFLKIYLEYDWSVDVAEIIENEIKKRTE